MKRAKDRLIAAAQAQGVPLRQVPVYPERPDSEMEEALFVSETRRHADLRLLEEELFAVPPRPSDAPARAVQLAQLRNPLEECMYAAALTRRLAYKRGWHWGDILILTGDPDAYAAPLQTAFQTYGIPLFQASSRSAARHALAEYLLSALQCVEKHFPPEEMEALLGTGFLPISQEEAEEFSHYATRYALRGSRFLQPLRKGEPDEIARMEGVRQHAVAPLIALRDGLRCAETLKGQLTALFAFLTESSADQKNRERIDRLARAERWTEAGEEAQVWNRLLGAMDQMVALMGEARLSAREIREVLAEALSASVIKALPQSADAVFAQGVESACTRTVKAVLVLGLSDRPAGADEGLLTPPQKQALSEFTGAYLGPDDEDRCRIRHYQMKSALGMATDYVSISYPSSGSDGSAQRPDRVFRLIQALYPDMKVRGSLVGEPAIERMLRAVPSAAVNHIARALSSMGASLSEADEVALRRLREAARTQPEARRSIALLRSALARAQAADQLNPATAQALYGALQRQSVSSLERFANCPFSYYLRDGLQAERVEPYAFQPSDEGVFFHDAVREFLTRSRDDLHLLSAEVAAQRMEGIAQGMLQTLMESGPLGDSARAMAQSRRLRAAARTCGALLATHMRGSSFRPEATERRFGAGDGEAALILPGGCVLEGFIDRVDLWRSPEGSYVRVIDYKRNGKAIELFEVYYGLRLQLPVYLAAAQRQAGARSAGVYYFPLAEGIVSMQSTDPAAVERERAKALRMDGLLPESPEVRQALSPQIGSVVRVQVTSAGELYKDTVTAGEEDYARVNRRALRSAQEHWRNIRGGRCAASPARVDGKTPCAFCDYAAACLFEAQLDAARVRGFKPLRGDEVLNRLKEEEGAPS